MRKVAGRDSGEVQKAWSLREDGRYLALAHCSHVQIRPGVARFILKVGILIRCEIS